jgi:hypothetical protein
MSYIGDPALTVCAGSNTMALRNTSAVYNNAGMYPAHLSQGLQYIEPYARVTHDGLTMLPCNNHHVSTTGCMGGAHKVGWY